MSELIAKLREAGKPIFAPTMCGGAAQIAPLVHVQEFTVTTDYGTLYREAADRIESLEAQLKTARVDALCWQYVVEHRLFAYPVTVDYVQKKVAAKEKP